MPPPTASSPKARCTSPPVPPLTRKSAASSQLPGEQGSSCRRGTRRPHSKARRPNRDRRTGTRSGHSAAPWNPRSKPIAGWIIPVLEWADEHGWRGTVTSGYRTFYEQAQLNAAGAYSAPAGLSNHETTAYPGGAVDVTEPGQLIAVLAGYRALELVGGVLGPIDPEHFSATGD